MSYYILLARACISRQPKVVGARRQAMRSRDILERSDIITVKQAHALKKRRVNGALVVVLV